MKPAQLRNRDYTGEQRLLLLDTWLRSDLSAGDFSSLVGVSKHTLYVWKRNFQTHGPAGLMGHRKIRHGSRLPEVTRRAILLMKEMHPSWGQDRIHDMLLRTQDLEASAGAVQRVLKDAGYVVERAATKRNPPKVTRFEAARPNKLWQTDLFSFLLKRQNRRVSMVAYMDDHSRFVTGFDVAAGATAEFVCRVFEDAIANYGAPEELLSDRGGQYNAWRGQSKFNKLRVKRGIQHRLSRPRHPQTLGKIERFWGTLYQDLIEPNVFRDLNEARERIAHFLGFYNFQRTHQGIGGLVPADRFFAASDEVRRAQEERVATNARELALHGVPRKAVYLTGRVGEESITLHSEGTKVFLTDGEGVREEVELKHPGRREEPGPGESRLDGVLEELAEAEASGVLGADGAPDEEIKDDEDECEAGGVEGKPGGQAGDGGDPGGALGPDDDE
ncbi:MAG: DDE-type integrase/transposase/recombinase [Planctomycetota bacterium]|nr:DDE-type integrase/transposase/recombinase [Planctomycetota bacterium]